MKKLLFAALLAMVLAAGLAAQQPPQPIDDAERRAVVAAAADALSQQYVFPAPEYFCNSVVFSLLLMFPNIKQFSVRFYTHP